MKTLFTLGLFAGALALPATSQAPEPELDLAVLYAGVEDAPRTATWLEFLAAHVRVAQSIDVSELSAETADGFDVVIVDSPTPFKKGGGFAMPKVAKLTRDFTKPTILMGGAGGAVLNGMKLKLDWL